MAPHGTDNGPTAQELCKILCFRPADAFPVRSVTPFLLKSSSLRRVPNRVVMGCGKYLIFILIGTDETKVVGNKLFHRSKGYHNFGVSIGTERYLYIFVSHHYHCSLLNIGLPHYSSLMIGWIINLKLSRYFLSPNSLACLVLVVVV